MTDGLETRGFRPQRQRNGRVPSRTLENYCYDCRLSRGACDQLIDHMDRLMNAARSSSGSGTSGLVHRYQDQITGRYAPGSVEWSNHNAEYYRQQARLQGMRARYERHCRPRNARQRRVANQARQWSGRPAPTSQMYRGPSRGMPRLRGGGGGGGGTFRIPSRLPRPGGGGGGGLMLPQLQMLM
ncbi:MAG: hypothetical protein AAGN82_24355 [Myxococcota bacterium]